MASSYPAAAAAVGDGVDDVVAVVIAAVLKILVNPLRRKSKRSVCGLP